MKAVLKVFSFLFVLAFVLTACQTSAPEIVPEYKVEDGVVKVNVGAVEHPMTEEHYIEWVSLQTKNGNQRKALKPTARPYVEFLIGKDDKVEAVYAYCNLHGLWKAQKE